MSRTFTRTSPSDIAFADHASHDFPNASWAAHIRVYWNGDQDLTARYIFDVRGSSSFLVPYVYGYSGPGASFGCSIADDNGYIGSELDTSANFNFGVWQSIVIYHDKGTEFGCYIENAQSGTMMVADTGGIGFTFTSDWTFGNSNTPSTTNGFDGRLADFAVWHRLLTSNERDRLKNGDSPEFIQGFKKYIPMIKTVTDRVTGQTGTETNITDGEHPRIQEPYPQTSLHGRKRTPHYYHKLLAGVGA